MDEKEQDQLISIGGLWLQTDKDGNPFFAGYLNGARLLIFKNKHKTEDKHPHYVMYVGRYKKRNAVDVDDVDF